MTQGSPPNATIDSVSCSSITRSYFFFHSSIIDLVRVKGLCADHAQKEERFVRGDVVRRRRRIAAHDQGGPATRSSPMSCTTMTFG